MSQMSSGADHGPGHYEIRLRGHLDPRWASWFDDLAVTHDTDGTTVLSGYVVDQSALHGLLHKVRDIGLPLVSVVRLDADQPPHHSHRKARP
jgi:hypothetical protein